MSSWYGGEPWAFINVSDRHLPQLRATVSQVYPVKRENRPAKCPSSQLSPRRSPRGSSSLTRRPRVPWPTVASSPPSRESLRGRSKGLEGGCRLHPRQAVPRGCGHGVCSSAQETENRQVSRKDTDPGLDSPQTPPSSSVQHSVPSLLTAPPSVPGSLPARVTFSFRPPWQGLL